jgi:hypothetical protein
MANRNTMIASPIKLDQNTVQTLLTLSPVSFLRNLQGLAAIDIEGLDEGRWRVISTLIHGNEPSGLFALHRWLSEQHQPATNIRIIISSVTAALTEPLFKHRFLPGEEDLNRCFSATGNNQIHARANQINALIREVQPEAVVDLHNTSGSGPAFCVSTKDGGTERALASFFCQSMILTGLKIGSLMEQDFACPIITIECGGSQDSRSHDVAYQGIKEFTNAMDCCAGHQPNRIEVLKHPLRVELNKGVSLSYNFERDKSVNVCICASIEHHNVGITGKGTFLAWINEGGLGNLQVKDEHGLELQSDLFELQDGRLLTSKDMRLFMATTRVDIAQTDCLFYVIVPE